jgi:hypothetical protein
MRLQWQLGIGAGKAMVAAALGGVVALSAADPTLISPPNQLAADAPEWRELGARMEQRGEVQADFEERRYFSFRQEPVVLRGEVRVSAEHGLSLHYLWPEARTLIIDDRGMIVREAGGRVSRPPDPRAAAANAALRQILSFDFQALHERFELYGRHDGINWSLALVPRDAGMRRVLGEIFVDGIAEAVRRIELRRSARQHVDIAIGPPAPMALSDEEAARFFR